MFSVWLGLMDSGHRIAEYTNAEIPYSPQCGCLGGSAVLASLDSMNIGAWGAGWGSGRAELSCGNHIFTGTLKNGGADLGFGCSLGSINRTIFLGLLIWAHE